MPIPSSFSLFDCALFLAMKMMVSTGVLQPEDRVFTKDRQFT